MQKQAEYPDIKIISKGAIRNNLTINDYDLCSILNNLLDNALEYSAKNNFSTVWLNIYLEASVLLIDVVNNISAPLDISKFSSTTKADNINHGLGLAIVKETVHYYNGSLKYELSESQITAKFGCLLWNNSNIQLKAANCQQLVDDLPSLIFLPLYTTVIRYFAILYEVFSVNVKCLPSLINQAFPPLPVLTSHTNA